MPDYTNNQYMSSPNADMYNLLAQQNAADRDRVAQAANRGGGGGAEIDMQGLLGQLASSQDAQSHATALEGLSQRANQRSAASLDQQTAEATAQRQSDLMSQQSLLYLQLAQAKGPARAKLEIEKQTNQEELTTLARQKIAADATFVGTSAHLQKELATTINNLQTTHKAAGVARDGVTKSVTDNFPSWLAGRFKDPTKEGHARKGVISELLMGGVDMLNLGGGNAVVNDFIQDAGVSTLAGSGDPNAIPWAKGLGELVLNPTTHRLGMLAAASRLDYFVDNIDKKNQETTFSPYTPSLAVLNRVKEDQYQIEADRYAYGVVGDLVLNTLSGSGIVVNTNQAQPAVARLIGELHQAISNPSMTSELLKETTEKALLGLTETLYGPGEGAHRIPQIIDLLDVTLEKLASHANEFQTEALAQGNLTVEQLQKASLAYAAEKARSLRYALRGATNTTLTTKGLDLALGQLTTATGNTPTLLRLTPGESKPADVFASWNSILAMDISTKTEMGKATRQALGPESVRTIEKMKQAIQTRTKDQKTLSDQEVDLTLKQSRRQATVTQEAEAQSLEAQIKLLQDLMARPDGT